MTPDDTERRAAALTLLEGRLLALLQQPRTLHECTVLTGLAAGPMACALQRLYRAGLVVGVGKNPLPRYKLTADGRRVADKTKR